MPSWPSSPEPYAVSAPSIHDPVLKFQVDAGYEVRRPRWSRSRRSYVVTYLGRADELNPVLDFAEREIRLGALSFAWTHPYTSALTSISAATPNVVTMPFAHGWQTGDQVTIVGTVSHNATYTITRVAATTFSLNGTAGGVAEGAVGTVALHLPYASLGGLENDMLDGPELQHDFGPWTGQSGLGRLTVQILEQFA